MAIRLDIVTPEARILSKKVQVVVVPGVEGELGVLQAHAPLVTTLKPGELRYTEEGSSEEHFFAIGEGVLEITRGSVSVLTDMAVSQEDIDESAVEEALKRAQDALEEKIGDEEIATVQAAIQKSLAQLHVKRRRRRV